MGPRSPHLRQLQVRQGADQLPREGDNRLRLVLEGGRAAGEGQQPHSEWGQEDECHGAAVAVPGPCSSALGAAGLPLPIYVAGRAVSHPQTPQPPTHAPFPR